MGYTRTVTLQYGKEKLTLEVTPEEMTYTLPWEVKTYNLVGGGYLGNGKNGIPKIGFSTFVPYNNSIFKTSKLTQKKIINTLQKWRANDRRVKVTIPGLASGEYYKITSLIISVREGDKDTFLEIELSYSRSLVKKSTTLKRPAEYKVKKGDTLKTIAKKYGISWQKVYEANKKKIGADPKKLDKVIGKVLKIP